MPGPLNRAATRIGQLYFIHDGLIMRRFVPLGGEPDPLDPGQEDEEAGDSVIPPVQPEQADPEPNGAARAVPRISRRDRALNSIGPVGRIVMPKALTRDVLNVFHGIPLTGHFGKNKTVHNVAQYFYWAGLTKDVHDRVRGCHVCQMRKQTRPMRHMHPGGFIASAP